MARVVASYEEAAANIQTYQAALDGHAQLAARIKQHPAWYAIKAESGEWLFGPSKFIGYADADARSYLAAYSRSDGRETEPALRKWFEPVSPDTALGRELSEAFARFAAAHGKTPNSRWRVSVPVAYLSERRGTMPRDIVSSRIAFDPAICGGRPHIRGTRIRVSDIVAAMAEGETVGELVADFPYLTEADVTAALRYAAGVVDHRVLVAA